MRPPDNLIDSVAHFCQKNELLHPYDNLVVGVSGGADSLCLLHLLTQVQDRFSLRLIVAHLNHQLRGKTADQDQAFVKKVAEQWNLPFITQTRSIAKLAARHQQSIEETARQMRYTFLWRVAEQVKNQHPIKIAVAHHADDQVETVLMHLLRGSGLQGLQGISPCVEIAPLSGEKIAENSPLLIRPLLETTRQEIETYCQAHQLEPREDASNQDTRLFRNRVRHELIPYLEQQYNPNIRSLVRRTAKIVAAEVDFVQAGVDKIWPELVRSASAQKITFDLERWQTLPLALKRAALRRAINTLRHTLQNIGFEHLETALEIIQKGQTGTQATLPHQMMISVSYETFCLTTLSPSEIPPSSEPFLRKKESILVKLPGTTPLPDTDWQLQATLYPATDFHPSQIQDSWEAYLDAEQVGSQPLLRTRRPGDIFYPQGLQGHRQKIKTFMINQKIPASHRDHIPLLVTDQDEILWVCGYRPDERAIVQDSSQYLWHFRFIS